MPMLMAGIDSVIVAVAAEQCRQLATLPSLSFSLSLSWKVGGNPGSCAWRNRVHRANRAYRVSTDDGIGSSERHIFYACVATYSLSLVVQFSGVWYWKRLAGGESSAIIRRNDQQHVGNSYFL